MNVTPSTSTDPAKGVPTVRLFTGLQAKMTLSYVVVTAAAVLVVEAIAIGFLLPSATSAADVQTRVQSTAAALAGATSNAWAKLDGPPAGTQFPPGAAPAPASPGEVQADESGGIVINQSTGGYSPGQDPVAVALLVGTDGRVLASSYPAQFPVGSQPKLPYDPATQFKGTATTGSGSSAVTWTVSPVTTLPPPDAGKSGAPASGKGGPSDTPSPSAKSSPTVSASPPVLGTVYVQAAASATVTGTRNVTPSLRIAAVILALLLPVGAVFGFLSTRRTVRRVRRLEQTTALVAAGDLDQRVAVCGRDELAGLEASFNTMAAQLQDSLDAEKRLSGASARAAERTRIARELHDSVSQDLFSLGLLAGGLRKALPTDSAMQPEVESLEKTSRRALREMQALLLELRPIEMEDLGLTAALGELCRAYRSRLGIEVHTQIAELRASTEVEHGVLRVVQEALANAVRHADPTQIWLTLQQRDGQVFVSVRDDGAGFDTRSGVNGSSGIGLGLGSMRQRVTELGGDLEIESAPGHGTTLSLLVPSGRTA
jgi:signal transduction histidine kinase